ncbi:MAG TPA: proteasome ATPase, partial [Acidimicrobiia bacterium]|nr:proteasome ATPase [Acidimicrobiia bacterium]
MTLESLRAEIEILQRKLVDSPKRIRTLEEKLIDIKAQLSDTSRRNERLSATLREAREHIAALRDEVEKLTLPPAAYGTYLGHNDDETVDIFTAGRKMRVSIHPEIELDGLSRGDEVVLNDSLNVIAVRTGDKQGELVVLREVLEDGKRALVMGRGDEERVCELADYLIGVKLRVGAYLLLDGRSGLLIEQIVRPEVEQLVLEEVPDIGYEDIGGLDSQIEMIHDAVELPYMYGDLFKEHELEAPKGILLYGPPGCGKTLIAKAVANSLAKRVAEKTGEAKKTSYFLNVKGPELLNKYVGETERQIRMIFERAREKAEEGVPVVIFFDEMDSLFRTRGTGISSDMESTIVPQLLAELDGVEALRNVIVIGASNREDLIDPAILRPGRLDVKIKIERPNENSAKEIFTRYLTTTLPLAEDELKKFDGDRDKTVAKMIGHAVEVMYAESDETRFLEVTYQNGEKEILHFKDFSSGAMIENIVRRAKKLSVKRTIADGPRGICTQDLVDSIQQEFREQEDLPNTTNPDDWAKISGKKGERIVYVRTLIKRGEDTEGGKEIERVTTGQ